MHISPVMTISPWLHLSFYVFQLTDLLELHVLALQDFLHIFIQLKKTKGQQVYTKTCQ